MLSDHVRANQETMFVVATAGHVDHGKSTLVKMLTGMEPDRWTLERERGMTIDLGYVWTTLPTSETVAFVDVPGHERYMTNMLAGVGPAPAVMFVVAADEGWKPQSEEHLAAIDAFGCTHGLLVITKSDLADPTHALKESLDRLSRSSLGDVQAVITSARSKEGIDDLLAGIAALLRTLPEPDTSADVRLWIDRSFTISGSGTVVTGTLTAGGISRLDELELLPAGKRVHIRKMESLGKELHYAPAVSRVALNLRGVQRNEIHRGDVLVSPSRWLLTKEVDLRFNPRHLAQVALGRQGYYGQAPHRYQEGPPRSLEAGPSEQLLASEKLASEKLPNEAVLHIGTARVPVKLRRLGADTARAMLSRSLPLRIGDPAVLRVGGAGFSYIGTVILDPDPPPLNRRGASESRARMLESLSAVPDALGELRRRGAIAASRLKMIGATGPTPDAIEVEGWLVDPAQWSSWRSRVVAILEEHRRSHPLEPGVALGVLAQMLEIADPKLIRPLVTSTPEITVIDGRALYGRLELPESCYRRVEELRKCLRKNPYKAPTTTELKEIGLGVSELKLACSTGLLVEIAPGVYLLPGSDVKAATILEGITQPFTVSEARAALESSRRVMVPLLERMDRLGLTRRLDDIHRIVLPRTSTRLSPE